MKTISNTLTESYEDRLANLQKEFGNQVVVTDLDAKHDVESKKRNEYSRRNSNETEGSTKSSENGKLRPQRQPLPDTIAHNNGGNADPGTSDESIPTPTNSSPYPVPRKPMTSTPGAKTMPPPPSRRMDPPLLKQTARHTRGIHTSPLN
jgi:hypothetical protein